MRVQVLRKTFAETLFKPQHKIWRELKSDETKINKAKTEGALVKKNLCQLQQFSLFFLSFPFSPLIFFLDPPEMHCRGILNASTAKRNSELQFWSGKPAYRVCMCPNKRYMQRIFVPAWCSFEREIQNFPGASKNSKKFTGVRQQHRFSNSHATLKEADHRQHDTEHWPTNTCSKLNNTAQTQREPTRFRKTTKSWKIIRVKLQNVCFIFSVFLFLSSCKRNHWTSAPHFCVVKQKDSSCCALVLSSYNRKMNSMFTSWSCVSKLGNSLPFRKV